MLYSFILSIFILKMPCFCCFVSFCCFCFVCCCVVVTVVVVVVCLFVCLFVCPQEAAMLVRSLPTKNRKRLAGDVFYNFATNAGLTDDVTDTDCKARNLSTHGRI